ncbi:MAG TPA: prepilin-type N-terminal cleavage/methylation domain-containing protein [Chthonomonadaceae bacterium]|nr:prepilin-type N-terminal cleavage/methylation domain-containing protein [Chthonomonadaceae bacterium]
MHRTFARKNRKGFTLVELLVVVLILAILMAVAIPAYLAAVHESQRRTCRANMQTLAHAEQAYLLRNPNHQYTANLNDLQGSDTKQFDLQALPKCPNGGTYSVDGAPTGPITLHCSIQDHDDNGNGGTGYQPGRDSE